jgi:predicted RNase H-like HicB family nuclease
MDIPVLVEQVQGNGFKATTVSPLSCTAEGATREEALTRVREMVAAKLASGAELTTVTISPKKNPWLALAGTLDPDHPVVKEWMEIMAERRREEDTVQEAS